MLKSRKVFSYDFNTGAGAQTITQEIELDLSLCKCLLVELKVTKADTDAGDTLDVELQDTTDRVAWHRRIRFTAVTGDLSPSATAPIYRRATINQVIDLAATEEVYTPDGSAGATALIAGTVINGPFPGKVASAGVGVLNSWRVSLTVVDADSDADFEGQVSIYDVTPN